MIYCGRDALYIASRYFGITIGFNPRSWLIGAKAHEGISQRKIMVFYFLCLDFQVSLGKGAP
jgi:hypothetical protein